MFCACAVLEQVFGVPAGDGEPPEAEGACAFEGEGEVGDDTDGDVVVCIGVEVPCVRRFFAC